MGQYYLAILLGPKNSIVGYVDPHEYENGAKLMEHSYLENSFVRVLEFLLSNLGGLQRTRLVWAGDYADREANGKTLYELASEDESKRLRVSSVPSMNEYPFLVNHTKREYVDKRKVLKGAYDMRLHPLPLLCSEGNGRGGGDYYGQDSRIGWWARDEISVERVAPEDYAELLFDLKDVME